MTEARPSVTAQRVAGARLAFDRVPAPFGDPAADERLARDGSSLLLCEGVAVYLDTAVLTRLLGELRALATIGTRLAVSLSAAASETAERRGAFAAAVAALGEPVKSTLTAADAEELFAAGRWRPVELSDRARQAGFAVVAPRWVAGQPPTASRVAAFMERMYDRRGAEGLAAHLERVYGTPVTGMRELDVGVYRLERRGGLDWVARLFAAARPLEAVEAEAEILAWLAAERYPAERCAAPDPVSVHCGQAVLVTEYTTGPKAGMTTSTFRRLGDLLGRLQAMAPASGAAARPGPAPAAARASRRSASCCGLRGAADVAAWRRSARSTART